MFEQSSLDDILGNLSDTLKAVPDTLHKITNDLAALQAQNEDIANQRWTLNNAVYQFNKLDPIGQLAVVAGLGFLAVHFLGD